MRRCHTTVTLAALGGALLAPDAIGGWEPLPPFACAPEPFVDDQGYLNEGATVWQANVWALGLYVRCTALAAADPRNPYETTAIMQENWLPVDRYAVALSRALPLVILDRSGPTTVCQHVWIPRVFAYGTVQGIALWSSDPWSGGCMSRMFIGRAVGPFSFGYTSRVFMQINPGYNPTDDTGTLQPFLPGPGGNGAVPVIGTDVMDTGVNWTFNSDRNVCFAFDRHGALDVSINGATIHTGHGFVGSLDGIRLESENNSGGANETIIYDDIVMTCALLPPVALPALTLPYHDDLQWGIDGLTIDMHDDDSDLQTPFRWTSAGHMPIVAVDPQGAGRALRMENLLRNRAPSLPGTGAWPNQRVQAATRLPETTGSTTRGWAVRTDARLTDVETSRTWAVARRVGSTLFERAAAIAHSSVTETFWCETPAPNPTPPWATAWVDTGVGLRDVGLEPGQTFTIAIHRALGGTAHFRINGAPLRYGAGPNAGQVVLAPSLVSRTGAPPSMIDHLLFLSTDESSAPVGSALYADNIRAWALPCVGDATDDGVVDFADLNSVLVFLGVTGAPGQFLPGNVAPDDDGDGVPDDDVVNFIDLNAVLTGFGVACD